MANLNVGCLNCGSTSLRIRTSEKIGMRSLSALSICNNCGAQNHIIAEVVKLKTASYEEQPEALSITKPLMQIDRNQKKLPIDN